MTHIINEEKNLPKLPVFFSTPIQNKMKQIEKYNQNNVDGISQWYEYIENLKDYISNSSIAWDKANRYSHFSNGAIHLEELEYDVTFIVRTNEYRQKNYVYIFQLDLKPHQFGLKVPQTTESHDRLNRIISEVINRYSTQYMENMLNNNSKQLIRLSESELRGIIKDSVRTILKEHICKRKKGGSGVSVRTLN